MPCIESSTDLRLRDIGLIKIDVEGFELHALQGAEPTIDRCRPVLYVENDRPENRRRWSSGSGRRTIACGGTSCPSSTRQFLRESEQLLRGVGSFNMLCVPREDSLEVEGLYEVLTGTHPLAERQRQS